MSIAFYHIEEPLSELKSSLLNALAIDGLEHVKKILAIDVFKNDYYFIHAICKATNSIAVLKYCINLLDESVQLHDILFNTCSSGIVAYLLDKYVFLTDDIIEALRRCVFTEHRIIIEAIITYSKLNIKEWISVYKILSQDKYYCTALSYLNIKINQMKQLEQPN